jgi:hypothetical protein
MSMVTHREQGRAAMEQRIEYLDINQLDDLESFNKSIYPNRGRVRERIKWQYLDNPLMKNKDRITILLLLEGEKNIVGQILLCPFKWHYDGHPHESLWGCDWYVLKEHRGNGKLLMKRTIDDHGTYFGIGHTEIAERIITSYGLKKIGNLLKFVWFRNPLSLIKLSATELFKRSSPSRPVDDPHPFSDSITTKDHEFELIEDLGEWEERPWENTLEFARPVEFLKWRFFKTPIRYHFYMTKNSPKPAYFVTRICFWRQMKMLVLVDYRVPDRDANTWSAIIRASKSLARTMGCDGVITHSSHRFFDRELKSNMFFKIGRDNFIMTYSKSEFLTDAISDRNLVFATSADSDVDLDFGDEIL